jgi:alpha-L-fucosidase
VIVKRRLADELQWFPESRFGMFVHFGLYALLGRGEWVMYHEDIPREEYGKLARRFNPKRFNADEWVETAKRCGARYMTVTAKHHDGFCLFASELTDYHIGNTPFGRDLIGELIDACHRQKMRIVLYYSQPDWHHPSFVHRPGAFKDLQHDRPGDEPNWPKFRKYVEEQVLELCTRYGRIDGIWFDGVHKTEREWGGRRLYRLIKQHQPAAVVNERAGYGDFFTPERQLSYLAAAEGYMVESCQAVTCNGWGYVRKPEFFSGAYLIESLARMAAAGGNYLLNIGPKPDGTLPVEQVERLGEVGEWLAVHGKAIYGTQGCPMLGESEEMLYTRSGDRVFLHLLRWPERDSVRLTHLRRPPVRARMLATGERLQIAEAESGVMLRGLPPMPPHPAANVIELVFDDDRILHRLPPPGPPAIHRLTSKGVVLPAETAMRRGFGPKGSVTQLRELPDGSTCIDRWTSTEQQASWQIECDRSIRCRIAVEMACPKPYAGSTFTVRIADHTLCGAVPETSGGNDFALVQVGTLELPAGKSRLTLKPEQLNYGYVFATVRRVVLTRA